MYVVKRAARLIETWEYDLRRVSIDFTNAKVFFPINNLQFLLVSVEMENSKESSGLSSNAADYFWSDEKPPQYAEVETKYNIFEAYLVRNSMYWR